MMNVSAYSLKSRFSSVVLQSTAIAALSTVGVLASLVPQIAPQSGHLEFEAAAYAQVSAEQLSKYTQVIYPIERERRQYYSEVQSIFGSGKVPENVCQQRNASAEVRGVCDRFNDRVRRILKENNMDEADFKRVNRWCSQSPKPQECPR